MNSGNRALGSYFRVGHASPLALTVDVPRATERTAPNEKPVAPPPPTLADVAPPAPSSAVALGTASEPLDVTRLTGRWDALVAQVRSDGKRVLASALEHALPVAVTSTGEVSIELDEPNEFLARAVESGKPDIVAVMRRWFPDARTVRLRQDPERSVVAPTRVTNEMVRTERLNSLRKRDPILGAAIDALDLDVVE